MFIYQRQSFWETGTSHLMLAPHTHPPLALVAPGTRQGHQTALTVWVLSKQLNLPHPIPSLPPN